MDKKKNTSITIRIDEDTKKKIEEQATVEHRETSDFVRHAVISYIEKIEDVRKMTGK